MIGVTARHAGIWRLHLAPRPARGLPSAGVARAESVVLLNTGHVKGKSSAAFGVMSRGWARGWRVGVVQFIKGGEWNTGERKLAEHLGITWHTMGDGFTWDTKNPEQDRKTARETWNLCCEKLRSGDYDMLVFDEIVYVLSYGMLPVEEVLEEIRVTRERQPSVHIVVTGRDAPKELIEAADLVTEMTEVKHPFQAGIRAQKGIEF